MLKKIMEIVFISSSMSKGEQVKPLIQATETTRDEARVTKAKLGMTWDEFVAKAAEELDPDNQD